MICDVGSGRGGTWNEEGVILFNSVNDGPLLRVSATGGTPVPFTTVDKAHEGEFPPLAAVPPRRTPLSLLRPDRQS